MSWFVGRFMPWGLALLSVLVIVEWNGVDHYKHVFEDRLDIAQVVYLHANLVFDRFELVVDHLNDPLMPDLLLVHSMDR